MRGLRLLGILLEGTYGSVCYTTQKDAWVGLFMRL